MNTTTISKCYCNKSIFMYTNISKNYIIQKCNTCKYNIEEIIKNVKKNKQKNHKNMLTSKLYWTKNTSKPCTYIKIIPLQHESLHSHDNTNTI